MRAPHHHDEVRARLGHHLGFEISAIHRFEVGDDRMIRETRAQSFDGVQPFGEEQRRAGFQPVDAGLDGDGGGLDRFVERGEIERELDDRILQVIEATHEVWRYYESAGPASRWSAFRS